jgi:polysaccharide pyruvyl transferase WcaK-like protein
VQILTQSSNESIHDVAGIKVGLFGFYSHHNYGDNLMAFMLARYLQQQRMEVVVYSKVEGFRAIVNADTETDLKQFVESVDLIVLGGGGLLVPHYGSPTSFDRELSQLVDICAAREKEIIGISIGGAGVPFEAIEPGARRNLLEACRYITLRNEEDLPLLSETGVPGECFADIVWCTPTFIPREPREESKQLSIGVCLRLSRGRRRKLVDLVFALIQLLKPKYKLVYLAVNPDDFRTGSAVALNPRWGLSSRHALVNMEAASEIISSLDVLVTNKLHVGVVAMSYGIPVFTLGAEQKTKLLFSRLGLSRYFWGAREFHKLFRLLSRKYLRAARITLRELREDPVQDAANHFNALRKLAECYAPATDNGRATPRN